MVSRELPQDFHALYDAGVRRARGGGAAIAAEEPVAVGDGLQVDVDEVTGLPNRVTGLAPTAEPADRAGSPEESVGRFLADHGDLWRLAPQDVAGVVVRTVSGTRLRTAHLVQRAGDVEVFDSEVTAALGPGDEVVSVAGQFFPGAADAARAGRADAPAALTAEEAIAVAARDLTGVEYEASSFVLASDGSGGPGEYRSYSYEALPTDERPAFTRPVRVKEVLFPLGAQTFSPAYYLELWIRTFPAFSYVVEAAGEPDVLFRKNLRADVAFTYRVHNTGDAVFRPEDGPAPGSPHPTGVPDGFQARPIPERLVTVESLLPGRPWLPDKATRTEGNNCVAYADLAGPDGLGPGDVFGTVTAPHVFDHTYDHAKPASDPENLQASLVGMFFHVNWLHDRWHDAGFDEAAGNAQEDDFGGGGLGGDPVLAEGNDFSGTDNANMQTPADGASPRMQMFEFRAVSPSRTSNHEALITFHEMGHYVTNRLVGNASGLANRQGKAMGEGWGDFFAICMTSQPTDAFDAGVFPVGGWTDLTPGFEDNYYFSIRRYPYSVDMAKNPLTFRHVSDGVVLPAGPPRNPNVRGSNSEVHNAGEVWCAALWEVFVGLVHRHGHTEAERRVLDYVIGGLKLTPSMPTFTQARDGIVSAVTALDPADLPDVWAGFAKRGMGVGAASPPTTSTSLAGVVESFATS
jgi:extracellular elastinolytic metalloproteinase